MSLQPMGTGTFSIQFYRWLVRLYPVKFRQTYGQDMIYVFHDLCSQAVEQRGQLGLFFLWLRTLPDLLRSVLKEHISDQESLKTTLTFISILFAIPATSFWMIGYYFLSDGAFQQQVINSDGFNLTILFFPLIVGIIQPIGFATAIYNVKNNINRPINTVMSFTHLLGYIAIFYAALSNS